MTKLLGSFLGLFDIIFAGINSFMVDVAYLDEIKQDIEDLYEEIQTFGVICEEQYSQLQHIKHRLKQIQQKDYV